MLEFPHLAPDKLHDTSCATTPVFLDKSSDKELPPLSSYEDMTREAPLCFQVLSEVEMYQDLLFLYGHHRWQD